MLPMNCYNYKSVEKCDMNVVENFLKIVPYITTESKILMKQCKIY